MPRSSDRAARLAALAFAAAAAVLGTLVLSDDPDMFHHLAMGRTIVQSGFPRTEPFLFSHRGEPFGAPPYWLGSVVIYLWHAAFGTAGLSLLPALVGGVIATLLLLDSAPRGALHRWTTLAAAAAPIALALETYRYRAVARTEIFSAAFLAFAMWALRRHEEGRSRALLAFPLVALLWTNVHPATLVALVPLAIFAVVGAAERLLRRALRVAPGESPSWRSLGIAAGVLAAALAARAVTPTPVNPVLTAARFAFAALRVGGGSGDVAMANAVRVVGEMQGGGLALLRTPVGALLGLAAISFVLRPRAIRPRELVTVAVFAVLPFQAVRFAMFFAIVAAPITARNLGAAVAALPLRTGRLPARAIAAALLAALALATLPLGALAPQIRFGAGLAHGVFPIRGTDYLRALRFEGRVFNTFQLGGYLEWAGLSPFQDGRAGTSAEDTPAAIAGPTQRWLFEALDARYRFDALLVTYSVEDPASAARYGIFDPDPGRWALVAFDDASLLYLRRDGRYAGEAARDEFRIVAPAIAAAALPAPDLAAMAELSRSVREAPDCFRCRYWLGETALSLGRPVEALAAVSAVVPRACGDERKILEDLSARAGARLSPARP